MAARAKFDLTVGDDISTCCGARVSYGDDGLYCKACYGLVLMDPTFVDSDWDA